jgi:hypothetical protein
MMSSSVCMNAHEPSTASSFHLRLNSSGPTLAALGQVYHDGLGRAARVFHSLSEVPRLHPNGS